MLKDKTVILGITGSIASYKLPHLASMLVKQHAQVHVIMTENAKNFVHPTTFETLTKHKCHVDTFDRNFCFDVSHVSLAKQADVMLIAPATANVIGKLAAGLADDMLSTTAMAHTAPLLIAPAMNTNMYEHPATQANLELLKLRGAQIIDPVSGNLACGESGRGKMPEPEDLLWHILRTAACRHDLSGRKVLVTAGPTREAIDPVRFISNHSSGRMGFAIARSAMLRGADVTLVCGPCHIQPPPLVRVTETVSAQDMYDAVMGEQENADIVIMAAAVADFRPSCVSAEKIKKSADQRSISLEPTKDILTALSNLPNHPFLCGFSMETEDLIANARSKLERKSLDMIVANSLREEGAGFGGDTNIITILTSDTEESLPIMSKDEAASRILDAILSREEQKTK